MPRKTSRAYRAGAAVHSFFAFIGHSVAVAATTTKDTVVDFAGGVKDGSEPMETKKQAKGPKGAVAT